MAIYAVYSYKLDVIGDTCVQSNHYLALLKTGVQPKYAPV